MLSLSPRRTLLPAAVLGLGLVLAGCGSSPGDDAPDPVAALPAPVQTLAVSSDVGQFFVTPEGKSDAVITETVAKLKSMDGVQSAERLEDGNVDLQFHPSVTPEQRQEALRQLAALGEVQEGI